MHMLEICVDSIESAMIAAKSGAHRLEVCSDLSVGGLTPSKEMVYRIKKRVSIPVFVIIRPRPGNFQYSNEELQCMIRDIKIMKKLKVDGLVFGVLNKDNNVDVAFCQQLLAESVGLPVTFHRAFDQIVDKKNALEDIISLGFKRVLTTSGPETAEEGIQGLHELVLQAHSRIIIMPGGGVTEHNLQNIVEGTKAKEFHSSGRTTDQNAEKSKLCSEIAIRNMLRILDLALYRQMLRYAAM